MGLNITASDFLLASTNGLIALTSSNAKAIGGAYSERGDISFEDNYRKIIHDEALEPFWQKIFSTIATKAINLPEWITMLPAEIIGSTFHWVITHPQSTNAEKINGENITGYKKFVKDTHEAVVKKPTDWVLDRIGLKENKENLVKYGAIQIGIFGFSTLAQKGANANIPGANMNPDDSLFDFMLKTAGFTISEQLAYIGSQTIRFYVDFKEEFGNHALAKSFACVANERAIPGHMASAIAGSIATYKLGNYIPRSAAAQIGKFPFEFLNRVLNCRQRRATNFTINEKGEKIANHRLNTDGGNSMLDACDLILDPLRDGMIKIIKNISGVEEGELRSSLKMKDEVLKKQAV